MPFGDRTGPAGLGPMTGRAAGYCAGYSVPGYMNPVSSGRGYWGRGGGGRGHRNWYYATGFIGWQRAAIPYPAWGVYPYGEPILHTITKEQELEALKNQAKYLEDTLGEIQKRIKELETQSRVSVEKKK